MSIQDDLLTSKRELLATLFRRKWTACWIVLVSVASAAFTVYYVMTPTYASDAVIIINYSLLTNPLRDAPPESDFEKLVTFHTQRDIIESTRLAEKAVEATNLAETRVIGRVERWKNLIGDAKRWVGNIIGYENWTTPWDPEAAAVTAVDDSIETAALPDSKAILVSYVAKDPEEAARVLSALLDAHSRYYYGIIRSKGEGMVQFLQEEAAAAARALQETEDRLVEFRLKDRLDPKMFAEDTLGSTPGFVSITDRPKIQQELSLYILKLEEELRLAESITDNQRRSRVEDDLKERLDLYVDVVNTLPGKELELTRLMREFEMAQDSFQLLQRNLDRARIVAGGATERMGLLEVFEEPRVNRTPISPKRRLVMVMSLVMGIVLAITWCFVADFMDHTVRSAGDVERLLKLRLLGSLHRIK